MHGKYVKRTTSFETIIYLLQKKGEALIKIQGAILSTYRIYLALEERKVNERQHFMKTLKTTSQNIQSVFYTPQHYTCTKTPVLNFHGNDVIIVCGCPRWCHEVGVWLTFELYIRTGVRCILIFLWLKLVKDFG